MTHYVPVMTRAAKDGQAQRKLTLAGASLPDDIRAAQDRLISQQRAVGVAMGARDNAAAEQDLRAMEDTLAAIEKFIGKQTGYGAYARGDPSSRFNQSEQAGERSGRPNNLSPGAF